jgi:hypothetical protein
LEGKDVTTSKQARAAINRALSPTLTASIPHKTSITSRPLGLLRNTEPDLMGVLVKLKKVLNAYKTREENLMKRVK